MGSSQPHKKSRCVFCGQTSYGRTCKFAGNKIHFHPNDPKKCAYCGSTAFGSGCKYSPNGIHVHGIQFNSMMAEDIQNTFFNNFLLQQLNRQITEFKAYKLGIIDEQGNKIKEPITEEEKLSYTSDVKTIIKLKRYLGSKLELINQTAILENQDKLNFCKEKYQKTLQYENAVKDILEQYLILMEKAVEDGLSIEQIKTLTKI
jgi:hypothetical protein